MEKISFRRTAKGKIVTDAYILQFPAFFPDRQKFANQVRETEDRYNDDPSTYSVAQQANFRVGKRRDQTYFFDCSVIRSKSRCLYYSDSPYMIDERTIRCNHGTTSLEDWIKSHGALELEEKTPDGQRQFFVCTFRTDKSSGWAGEFTDSSIVANHRGNKP